MKDSKKGFKLIPIGYVRNKGKETFIEVLDLYIPALKELEHFSHVHIFWWADKSDNKESRGIMQTTPPYGENPPITGVFATRAEYRPNPIALTTTEILEVNHKEGFLKVSFLDAFPNTPVVDLKAYFPICDRVREVRIAPWLKDWPEWYEDGLKLYAEQGVDER